MTTTPPRSPRTPRTWAGALAVAGLVSSATLIVTGPVAVAAPTTCTPIIAEPAPAIELVDTAAEVPRQAAGPDVTDTVRDAVADELAADKAGATPAEQEDAGQIWLDTCGQAFYADPVHDEVDHVAGGATRSPTQQLFPLEQTFQLSSRPGSDRTIYLDFTGHTLTGTAWNGNYGWGASVSLAAYDYEGGASTYTDTERINIQNTWALVAEDFAPFDVNVTTIDPGSAALARTGVADTQYGTRAVITNDKTGQDACNCGGVAYMGVFNNPNNHTTYQPAFVFTDGVGFGAKSISEALSHEVGHNLGLAHQGQGSAGYYTGHGSWAPIMGVGYYKPVSQWSRGEYPNPTSTQDELTTITSTGLDYRPDDHGDTPANATALTGPLSAGVTTTGVITTPTDIDVHKVTLGSSGNLTVTAAPTAVGANLDIALTVRDAAGNVVADDAPPVSSTSTDRADGLDASVTLPGVPAGTYYLSVDGVGVLTPGTGGYSDYGSLGQYDLVASATSSSAPILTSSAPLGLTTSAAYRHVFAATATDGTQVTWSLIGALPKGIAFDAATGSLAGKTTVKGTFPVTVTATDTSGRETSRTYKLNAAAPVVAGALAAKVVATVGTAYPGQLSATGGASPYTWAASKKPDWATVSTSGAVTGTPTAAGPDQFTLTVTDAAGRTASKSYTLTVNGPLVARDLSGLTGSVAGGVVTTGRKFSFGLPVYGGKRPYTFTPGALPEGVTLSKVGLVTGTLAAEGTYPVTFTVGDAAGAQTTRTVSVRAVAPLVVAGTAPAATLGVAFHATFAGGGGVAPYTLTATGLPSWVTFNADTGELSGTPAVASTSGAVSIKVTDATGKFVVRRIAVPVRSVVVTTTTALPGAVTGKGYAGRLAAVGGSSRYTWAVTSGTLPAGMKLATTGSLSGVPTAAGTATVVFTATDSEGRSARTREMSLAVSAPVTVVSTALPAGKAGQPYTATIDTTGGSGTYTYSTGTALPYGMTLSADGVLSGTPAAPKTVYVSVKVTDSAGRVATKSLLLKVTAS